jgi:hypothetical protein
VVNRSLSNAVVFPKAMSECRGVMDDTQKRPADVPLEDASTVMIVGDGVEGARALLPEKGRAHCLFSVESRSLQAGAWSAATANFPRI